MTASSLYLHVLGVEVTLQFARAAAAAQAAQMFALLQTRPWRSPDILIECDWPEMNRSFIRSRPSDLDPVLRGVRVRSREHPQGTEWRSTDPPFPPIGLAPFKDRFVRLHSGAVAADSGRSLLVLGESGDGKSTVCGHLVTEYGFRLLTDEDVFLHRRTRMVEPFPVRPGQWKSDSDQPSEDQLFRPELVSTTAGTVSAVLLLRRTSDASDRPRPTDTRTAMWGLLESQRPGGSAHGEAVATLAELSRSVPVYEMAGGHYSGLLAALPEVAQLVGS